MYKINIGMIGGGFNGQIGFIENFYKNKKCKILGLVEARKILRKKIAKKYKIKKTYKTHLDLIKEIDKFDGIAIVTKRNMIGPLANQLLKYGKPILTEKPMAGNSKQARKLINTAKKYKTMYKIGYNKIFDEGVISAKNAYEKLLKNKKFGKVVFIKSHRLSGSGYDKKNYYIKTKEQNSLSKPNWQTSPEWLPREYNRAYDKYLNLYCHNLSLLRYFTNEIPSVDFSKLSDDNMSVVCLRYKKFNAILETGFFTKDGWDETFEIYFEYGSIKIKLPPQHYKNKSAEYVIYDRKEDKKFFFKLKKKSWSFANQINDFLDDIKKKKIIKNKPEDGYADIYLIEQIWKKYLKNDK